MKIALIGYGKMGKAIEEIAIERGHSVNLKITSANLEDFNENKIQESDVAIEFTNPEVAYGNIKNCLNWHIPTVAGSTGWLEHKAEIEQLTKDTEGTFLYASNFSIGVNLFFELNKYLAKLMALHKEYEVSLEEIHHTAKKDAPSGTAITLGEQVMQFISEKKHWVNEPSANDSDLFIKSIRQDPAPGTHSITYHSEIDDIEIIHTAHSRKGFALGAVLAAEFIAQKKGIFQMSDVLGL
ncbi:4-hydroxy-tetrahydrodipicolinate reductase [Rhizosphaericola mali]|uniref:4-hydroxy-tetrahydrodipicolinate reductase n=1 Tax=Rhizosphaericola mali TaxID=2545455 RepID=A0A5P2FVQ2_9BACT|nr:4-hydroxy-tetrahydrodipicolinate reductase [Rhizosphaericola mali]QES87225.1 4-hydroxy-tetrahydrodipicolinate reductase [Rhizosphaericola mali]